MTDLIEGRADLADCRGAVACGGFSFGDVLGAGRGWAATFRYNARAPRRARALHRARRHVPARRVQRLPDARRSRRSAPRRARAGRASCATAPSSSRRASCSLAHRATARRSSSAAWPARASRSPTRTARAGPSSTPTQLAALERAGLVAARFVDGRGDVADDVPGEPERLARRHRRADHARRPLHDHDAAPRARVPHRRSCRGTRPTWGEDSPWMRMFRNARAWVG